MDNLDEAMAEFENEFSDNDPDDIDYAAVLEAALDAVDFNTTSLSTAIKNVLATAALLVLETEEHGAHDHVENAVTGLGLAVNRLGAITVAINNEAS